MSNPSSHTVPHWPSYSTSRRPSDSSRPPYNRSWLLDVSIKTTQRRNLIFLFLKHPASWPTPVPTNVSRSHMSSRKAHRSTTDAAARNASNQVKYSWSTKSRSVAHGRSQNWHANTRAQKIVSKTFLWQNKLCPETDFAVSIYCQIWSVPRRLLISDHIPSFYTSCDKSND